MAKRKSSRSRGTSRSKRTARLKKFRLPRAFKIVPIKLRGRVRKHAHVLGQAAIPPCPPGFVFVGRITIGNNTYCIYVNPDTGATILMLC